ncbi:hypothetical protein [Tsuneonella rigui]|uniref:AbiTii domain-containing protein n=1 Tax=Tsuneonella rigui TaxID=1708790 RepID=UPI000F7DD0E4|nr:hypothetical protein [Tsuneonella rigui]
MKSNEELLLEVINGAVDGNTGVSVLLRKCRLLSDFFKNDNLTDWVTKELNGYDDWKNLPTYRVLDVGAKGLLLGPFNAQINAQPLASAVLEKEHRHFAESVFLREPASAYEGLKDEGDGGYRVEWPGNLVLKYQSSFIKGYALNIAWQDIPVHALRTVPETVKNRVLEFALSLRNEFGESIDAQRAEVSEFIDSAIMNILNGGKV